MSYLESLGIEVLERRVKKYARSLATEVKQHITHELERHMSQLTDSLDRLSTNISNELDQVRKGLQDVIDGLTEENADLKAQLQEQLDGVVAAQAKVDSLNSDLEANDPVEPAPDQG